MPSGSESMQLWTLLPSNPNKDEDGVIEKNYDVLAGELDETTPGLILQVNSKNQVSASVLKQLGFNDKEKVSFSDIMKKELKVIVNDDYYQEIGGNFIPNQDLGKMYNSSDSITVKVQAIIRGKDGKEMVTNGSGLGYTLSLIHI